MRSLAYKSLIWNSNWYKKYSRPMSEVTKADFRHEEKEQGQGFAKKHGFFRLKFFGRSIH
jgi:hypothetical protein